MNSSNLLETLPATDETTESTVITIPVTFDPYTPTPVTIDWDGDQPPTFGPRLCVRWIFQGLEDDADTAYSPVIAFKENNALTLGPFTSLRKSATEIWGQGNTGQSGDYCYQIGVARSADGSTIGYGTTGTLRNLTTSEEYSPVVRVVLQDDGESAEVYGEICTLFPQGAVIWQFENFPAGSTPFIRFTEYEGPSEDPIPSFGPFTSLEVYDDKSSLIGNGHNGIIGRFFYDIWLAEVVDGQIQQRRIEVDLLTDPIIDSEGSPVYPESTELRRAENLESARRDSKPGT